MDCELGDKLVIEGKNKNPEKNSGLKIWSVNLTLSGFDLCGDEGVFTGIKTFD